MLVKHLGELAEFTAGDDTRLREILNPDKDAISARYSLAYARLPQGSWSTLHVLRSSEVYYLLEGKGRMEIDGEQRKIQAGDTVYIPPNSKQRVYSEGPGDLVFLCVVDPAWRKEDENVLKYEV